MATGRLPDPNTAPVTAKGDLYTYSTVPAKLAVGNNGETLVADSSTSTGLRYQGQFQAGKNYLLNGDMRIWQRGTSIVSNGAYAFTADRLAIYTAGSQTWTRTADAPTGVNLNYCVSNSTSVATWYIVASVELAATGVSQFKSGNHTFSFYGKFDNGRSVSVAAYYADNTGGSNQTAALGSTTVTGTGSWTRYTMTFDPTSVSPAGTSQIMRIWINDGSGTSSTTVRVTGLQLEAGSVATAFQTATGTLAGELAAASRYYYRVDAANAGDTRMNTVTMIANSTTVAYGAYIFPVRMRTSPTFGSSTASGWSLGRIAAACTAMAQERSSQYSSMVKATVASGLTAGNGDWLEAGNNNTAYIEFSAEL